MLILADQILFLMQLQGICVTSQKACLMQMFKLLLINFTDTE